MDGEIRQNKATKEWVIMAPAQSDRPLDFRQAERERPPLPSYDPKCPFCPGNEHRLLSVLQELPGGEAGPWQTRVVPNRYPGPDARGIDLPPEPGDLCVDARPRAPRGDHREPSP